MPSSSSPIQRATVRARVQLPADNRHGDAAVSRLASRTGNLAMAISVSFRISTRCASRAGSNRRRSCCATSTTKGAVRSIGLSAALDAAASGGLGARGGFHRRNDVRTQDLPLARETGPDGAIRVSSRPAAIWKIYHILQPPGTQTLRVRHAPSSGALRRCRWRTRKANGELGGAAQRPAMLPHWWPTRRSVSEPCLKENNTKWWTSAFLGPWPRAQTETRGNGAVTCT